MSSEHSECRPVHLILSRLNGVRRRGNGWIARCPSHEDRSPSLSIAEAENANILLHCFAGCSAADALAAIDLTLADLYANRTRTSSAASKIAIRKACREADWAAALNVLDREVTILLIVAEMMLTNTLSVGDVERLKLAAERIQSAREVLK